MAKLESGDFALGHAPAEITADAPRRAFQALLVLHVALWTVVPAITYENLPQDTAEGLVWGRLFQFGYDKHPFLAPWLTALATDGFGVVGWPVFLVSQLAVAGCFWYVWRFARALLDPWDAFVAVALLEGIHYYTLSSFTFNPNLMMLPTWAAITFTVWRAVESPTPARWAAAGLWVGLGLISKYAVALLLAPLGLVLLAHASGRAALRRPGFALGALVAAAIFAPHVAWLIRHDWLPLRYAVGSFDPVSASRHATGGGGAGQVALKFLGEQLLSAAPALALFLLAYGRPRGIRFDRRKFADLYLLAAAAGPMLLTVIAGLFDAALVGRWGFPYLTWSGIALLRFTARSGDAPLHAVRRVATGAAAIASLLVAAQLWLVYAEPLRTGRAPYSMLFPGRPLAAEVTGAWHRRFGAPLPMVAAPRWLAATVAAYAIDRPVPYFDWLPERNPWLDPSTVERDGAAFVVEVRLPEDERRIDRLLRRYPQLDGIERIWLAPVSPAPLAPHQFWIALLPPRAAR
jgi:4-amino-4-deoxy-L-arabinose transferase-like glycosyltransferase